MTEIADKPDQYDIAFLLKKYEESWAQARHIDEYMERVPRFFLIVVGAVAAATAALIRFSDLTNLTFIAGGVGLVILALIGFTASLTIPRYRVTRNSYFNAIYLIHKYFADRTEDLRKYIGLQIGGTFPGYRHPLRVDFFRFMMMVIMDSSLMAVGLYSLQNAQALVSQQPMLSWLVWALPTECILFFALHVYAYFYVIKFYEPKHQEN